VLNRLRILEFKICAYLKLSRLLETLLEMFQIFTIIKKCNNLYKSTKSVA